MLLLTVGLERPSGRRYLALARELQRAGYRVRVITLHPDFAACRRRRFTVDGVEVWYVGQMHVRKTGGHIERFGPLRLLWVLLHSTIGLTLALWLSPAEIYHLGKPQPLNGLAAWLALVLRGRPYLLDCDDDEAAANRLSAAWQRRIFALAQQLVVNGAAALTVNTSTLAQRWQQPQRPLARVANGADPAVFCARPAAERFALRQALGAQHGPLVAYAGTLALQSHAVDLLLSAFGLVQQQLPQARLLLIGSGPDMQRLQQSVARQSWAERVIWAGEVSERQTALLLATADVSVDPVRDDAAARARAPLKLVESLMLGVPVVTSPVGDRAELLAAGSGLLVAPGDAAALAVAIRRLLSDEQLHADCRRAALRQREQLSWAVQARPWLALYRSLGLVPAGAAAEWSASPAPALNGSEPES